MSQTETEDIEPQPLIGSNLRMKAVFYSSGVAVGTLVGLGFNRRMAITAAIVMTSITCILMAYEAIV